MTTDDESTRTLQNHLKDYGKTAREWVGSQAGDSPPPPLAPRVSSPPAGAFMAADRTDAFRHFPGPHPLVRRRRRTSRWGLNDNADPARRGLEGPAPRFTSALPAAVIAAKRRAPKTWPTSPASDCTGCHSSPASGLATTGLPYSKTDDAA